MLLISKMSQDFFYDVLLLNAPVRRIGDDSDRSPAATANLDINGKNAFQALLPRAWSQVIAA
jgi:hypothetical protein